MEGWTNIADKWPELNTEVVIFYAIKSAEGTSLYESEVIHEKLINAINSPIMYWIKKPRSTNDNDNYTSYNFYKFSEDKRKNRQ